MHNFDAILGGLELPLALSQDNGGSMIAATGSHGAIRFARSWGSPTMGSRRLLAIVLHNYLGKLIRPEASTVH